MNTETQPTPTYPAVFQGCDLDATNYKLRMGYASQADAEQLVYWWNTSGKRMTTASLGFRSANLGGRVSALAPYISISAN